MNVPFIELDPGHGGKDPGACLGARHEADDVLKLALAVGKHLISNYVCEVGYTRTTDIYESPSKKADDANKADADLFVSFHRNDAEEITANGFEALVHAKTGIKYKLATAVCNDMENLGYNNRGVKVRRDLTVLVDTNMNAVLFEFGFIRNTKDNKLFDLKFDEIVVCVAKNIAKVMNLKKKNDGIVVGDKVRINKGAVYAGAHAGKEVSTYARSRVHTVKKIDQNKNCLLKEINSWVNVKYLYEVK